MTDETTLTVDQPPVSAPTQAEPIGGQLAAAVLSRLAAWSVTVEEAVAWTAIVGLTLVSRLLFLGNPPLNLDESRRAMEAYTLLHDGRVTYESAPILTNLTSVMFGLFGESDLQARLVPAVCGVLLVLSPLLLRSALGGWWSALASIALLLSSTLLTNSRAMSPALPALLCLTLTAISAWRFGLTHERHWLALTMVAALIGLGLDTSFMVGLIGLLLAYAIAEGDIFGRSAWWEPVSKHARLALAIGVGAAILLETRFFTNPQGLQAGLVDPLTRWIGEIARGAGLTAPLLVAMLDGSILILAMIGLLEYPKYPRAIRFLGTWTLVSLTLASLMRMPESRYLVQPVVPAAMLAGYGLLKLWSWLVAAGCMRSTMIGLLGLVPVVTAGFQINIGLNANLSPWNSAAVVLLAGLLLAGLLAFNMLRGAEIGAAFATWLLVLLAAGNTAGMMRALDARGEDRGQLVEQSVVTPDIQYVREIALKWYRAEPSGVIAVDPALRPLVEWSLRGIPTVRYDVTAGGGQGPRLLTDAPAQTPPDGRTTRWIVGHAVEWPTFTLQPSRVWRWIVQRGALVTLRPYGIVVVQPAGS